VNLINSAVVDQPLEVSLELRQELHVIDKVPIDFLQLLQHTLWVVVRLATLEDLVDAVVAVFDEFAVPQIHQVGEDKDLLMIDWFNIGETLLIWFEELVEYYECPLII